jgi:uncharacterized membrane protein
MSEGEPIDKHADSTGRTDTATVEDLFSDLRRVREEDGDAETREEVLDVKHLLAEAYERGLIDSGVRDLEASDAAQAFVGSVIFASPLLVEDGIFDIADYLFEFTVAGVPIFLITNTVFVVFMTYALLEWTGRNKEDTDLLFGVFPARVLMVLAISFAVSALLMTVWGRVEGWQSPTEALARINVIWTVGSLGAALGDIVSDGDTSPVVERHREGSGGPGGSSDGTDVQSTQLSDSALVAAINQEFDELEATVDDTHEVKRIREETIQAALDNAFGTQINKYTSRDIAEAFVGSIIFAVPFLVEDGVFDVADFFLSFRVGAAPIFFLVNTAFVLVMILALVYWAGPQDVQVSRPVFGFIPRRLIGIAAVSFLTAAALMTMWGRVDNWQDPVVAIARISVVWTVASFGASLGDILPGESSGDDINDDLAALGDGRDERRGSERSE